jgi:hypothetical protein
MIDRCSLLHLITSSHIQLPLGIVLNVRRLGPETSVTVFSLASPRSNLFVRYRCVGIETNIFRTRH